VDSAVAEKMRRHEQTGRPLGSESFMVKLEKILDRMLRPKRPGPKIKEKILETGTKKGN
jgi:putative transposase